MFTQNMKKKTYGILKGQSWPFLWFSFRFPKWWSPQICSSELLSGHPPNVSDGFLRLLGLVNNSCRKFMCVKYDTGSWRLLFFKHLVGFNPFEKYESNLDHLPQIFGVKIPKNIWVATTKQSMVQWKTEPPIYMKWLSPLTFQGPNEKFFHFNGPCDHGHGCTTRHCNCPT